MSSPVLGSSSPGSFVEGRPLVDLTDRIELHSAIRASGGAHGDVYKCRCRGMTESSFQVAVKVLRYYQSSNPEENRRQLDRLNIHIRRELGLLRRLEHPNLVPLLGVATIFEPTLGVVFPWMSNGTLHSFSKKKTFTMVERLQLALGIASGLECLHSNDVFHGDFHSGNILIDKDQKPRISDFGLTCTIKKVQPGLTYLQRLSNTNNPGSTRWAAPERLSGSKPHPSGDIYSFGCILFEVLFGEVPWKEKTDFQVIALKLTAHELPSRGTIANECWELMVRCWSTYPQQRPNAGEIVLQLRAIILNSIVDQYRDQAQQNIRYRDLS